MVAVAPLTIVEPLAEMEEAAVEPLVKMKSDRVRAALTVVKPLAEMEEAAVEPLVKMKSAAFAPLGEARAADQATGRGGDGGGRAAGEATAERLSCGPKQKWWQSHR